MKRIRIGNDIRVQTTLHELTDFDATMIKQLRCYFIPKSDDNVNPFPQTYDPAQYNICNCGKPMYNVFPCNIDAPHWFPGYNGFGVNSTPFMSVKREYLAPSRLLAEQNKIEAYFPAADQKLLGEYKVVIVLTLYQAGWGTDNLRTYTIDKGVVFALTSDNRDIDTDTVIDMDVPYITEIVVPDTIIIEGDSIDIKDNDYEDTFFNIELVYSDGTIKEVNDSDFDTYIRTHVHNMQGIINIDNTGTVTRDKYQKCIASITFVAKEDPSIMASTTFTTCNTCYKIRYSMDDDVTVDGTNEVYVADNVIEDWEVGEFTITSHHYDQIKSVKARNATIKIKDGMIGVGNNPKYGIYTPIEGTIEINIELKSDE